MRVTNLGFILYPLILFVLSCQSTPRREELIPDVMSSQGPVEQHAMRSPAQERAAAPLYGNVSVRDFTFQQLADDQFGGERVEFTLRVEPEMGCVDFDGVPLIVQTLDFSDLILSPVAKMKGDTCMARDRSTTVKTVVNIPLASGGSTFNYNVKMPFRGLALSQWRGNVTSWHVVQFTIQPGDRLERRARVLKAAYEPNGREL